MLAKVTTTDGEKQLGEIAPFALIDAHIQFSSFILSIGHNII